MKVGFVNIFGKPNAGKSTLLNALIGEKMAIVSSKVQTTRHRIKAFLNTDDYQVIFSDTPGIIEPKYKLHEKMMGHVKSSLEDADLAILLADITDDYESIHAVFSKLRLKVPAIVVLNKADKASESTIKQAIDFFAKQSYCKKTVVISALKQTHLEELLQIVLGYLPEGEPFYDTDDLTDLPTRFFTAEMIREKIFECCDDEIPYHTAVMINEFKEKTGLIKITADIIVHRETQKAIIIGKAGTMIKKIGSTAREEIEKFLGSKVFLELFVKVRPKWRDNDTHLKEYGY